MSSKLLLLSNSSAPGKGYLEHVLPAIDTFLGEERTIYFAPYALADYDGYTAQVAKALKPLGISVIGLHTQQKPRETLASSAALFVGGGNSFRLLKSLQELDLISVVRERVASGALRYIGSSAGTNMACPSLRTTNDMPIVQPTSFESFGLIPFQINPHYIDPDPRFIYMGETREQRLLQFLEENDVVVLGLREGTWLHRDGQRLQLHGETGARLFRRGQQPQEIEPNSDLSWLLDVPAHFDQRA
ncbi:dipeptidase E [Thermosporothrix hazakensis]|jgi:dipeptidase E|uniref:dipeptidase E n=1 Tax=Thermosporothrix hazakensis TaxID=644383 RepID=A0A326UFH9_THEHA|nr:dipeptidase PepE [Thermosporothrix hazakensis]PZW29363.1 dipeptidase E [Thermosporothrix hazakensis]GCE45923.1 peptidase E [Thermosporothrix hazakensis]